MALSSDILAKIAFALNSPNPSQQLAASIGFPAGNTYFVDSTNGASSDVATRLGTNNAEPFATLAYALTRVAASKGDTIVLMPGHAETTTAVASSVAGVSIVGIGWGRLRPALTATTAATNLLNVTGANVYMENIRFVGAASGCTGLLDINAADFYGKNLVFEHGAAPVVATLVEAAAHRFVLEDCRWRGTAAGPTIGIRANGKVNDWAIIRPRADYGGSSGLDTAWFFSSFKMYGYQIIDPIIIGFDTVTIDINSSTAAVGDGVVYNGVSIASTGITVANAIDAGGAVFINHMIGDTVAAKGLVIPSATPT